MMNRSRLQMLKTTKFDDSNDTIYLCALNINNTAKLIQDSFVFVVDKDNTATLDSIQDYYKLTMKEELSLDPIRSLFDNHSSITMSIVTLPINQHIMIYDVKHTYECFKLFHSYIISGYTQDKSIGVVYAHSNNINLPGEMERADFIRKYLNDIDDFDLTDIEVYQIYRCNSDIPVLYM